MDTRIRQAKGLGVVADIVQVGMQCGWQEIAAINDNGIDGLIIDRIRGIDTGTIYHIQIKCGNGYLKAVKKRPDYLCINLGATYINEHRPRWNKLLGPVILIYVDFESGKAWWTNIKSDSSYCPSENRNVILIPISQRFGVHSIGELRSLRGFYDLDRQLEVVELAKDNLIAKTFSTPLKTAAKKYYRNWAADSQKKKVLNEKLGIILVSRVGWRHITRRGRGLDNIMQSWALLGAARQIISTNNKPYQLRSPNVQINGNIRTQHDYVSLRSIVVFPNRQQAVVQVVIKRKLVLNQATGIEFAMNWFYSVHEPRKAKNIQ